MESISKSISFKNGRELNIIELGCDNTTVTLTSGKIILWFGRKANESMIRDVIFGISNVDLSVTIEQEIICDFKKIAEYENMGYVLTSYAKTRGGYRVIFNIPFSKRMALSHFVRIISGSLQEKDIKKTILWDGSREKMIYIYNKLKNLDGWEIKKIDYKENIKDKEKNRTEG